MKIRFSSQNSFGSWLIRAVTFSEWSHVEFVLDDGRVFGARFQGGVKVRDPLTDYRAIGEFEFDAPGWDKIAFSQEGAAYDNIGLFGWLFRLDDWQAPGKWTCSELVAWVLQQLGIIDVGLVSRISPRELFLILKNVANLIKKIGGENGRRLPMSARC